MTAGTANEREYRFIKQILPYARRNSDLFETGCTLYTLGIMNGFWYCRLKEAEPLLRESVEVFQMLDDPLSQGMIFKTRGYIYYFQGRYADHLALAKRELAIYQDLGDRRMIGISHAEVGEFTCHLGNYAEAETHIRTGMALLKGRVENEYALRHRYLGDALLAQGKVQEALESYQLSLQYFLSVGEKAWTMNAFTGLSRAEFALGNRIRAWENAFQALRLYREGNAMDFFVYQTLAVFALLLADKGDIQRALGLYGKAMQQPALANSRWFADLYGSEIEKAVTHLTCAEQDEWKKAGQAMDISEIIEPLLIEHGMVDKIRPD